MEHSKYFEKVKRYYDAGIWSKAKVREAVNKGWITPEEMIEIIGVENEGI